MMAVCVLAFALFAIVAAVPKPDEYTTKYDNVDLDEILGNKRLLASYTNCLLDKGACTPDGAELKKVLPEALETNCAKCTEKQNQGSRKVLEHLIKNEEAIFAELEQKYDPSGSYKTKYCQRAKDENIDTLGKC